MQQLALAIKVPVKRPTIWLKKVVFLYKIKNPLKNSKILYYIFLKKFSKMIENIKMLQRS